MPRPYTGRSVANWADFLGHVEEWIPSEVERVYAIADNLKAHRATDVLLFCLAHPRWEFVFQPKYAAYLNLIEPCVEGAQEPRAEGWAVRELGPGLPSGRGGNSVLEPASAPVREGQSPATPAAPPAGHRGRLRYQWTCRMNHLPLTARRCPAWPGPTAGFAPGPIRSPVRTA
jgi:hypothetical protein